MEQDDDEEKLFSKKDAINVFDQTYYFGNLNPIVSAVVLSAVSALIYFFVIPKAVIWGIFAYIFLALMINKLIASQLKRLIISYEYLGTLKDGSLRFLGGLHKISNYLILCVTIVLIITSAALHYYTVPKIYLWGLFGFVFIVMLVHRFIIYLYKGLLLKKFTED